MVTRGFIWVLIASLVLAACRNDSQSAGDSVFSQPPTFFAPTAAVIVAGCETDDLENWLEQVMPNARAFRDESAGVATVALENILTPISRLNNLLYEISQAATPECVAPLQGLLQKVLTDMLAALTDYQTGQIDQTQLNEQLVNSHSEYDNDIQPKLDEAAQILAERFQSQ